MTTRYYVEGPLKGWLSGLLERPLKGLLGFMCSFIKEMEDIQWLKVLFLTQEALQQFIEN